MKAVIMAGGFGTRLRPLTIYAPKPMVPIVNRPVMEHVVELVKNHGFLDLMSLLYFQPEVIERYFGSGESFGVNMHYIRPDTDWGTAGSVKRAQEFLDGTFLVISADLLTDVNLQAALRFHQEKKALATIVLTRVKNPLSYGIVITDAEGRIRSFLEKPTWGEVFSDTINTGIYILEPEVLEKIPNDRSFDFSKDLFPLLLNEKLNLYGTIAAGYWKDIGNVNEYLQANMDVLDGEVSVRVLGERINRIGKDVWLGKNVALHPRVNLRGTVILGDGCVVENGVVLANCVLGRNCRIHEGVGIEDSVLWNEVQVGARSSLNRSVIGNGGKIGNQVIIQEGVVISDDCYIGNGAVIAPGVRIWPQKRVDGGATVTSSLIWGERWSKNLFGNYGITGLANLEVTPEFGAKVGAAYGTVLKKGQYFLSAFDGHRASRLIHRSLMGGLLSTGINVYDLSRAAIPVTRHAIRSLEAEGGVQVSISPFNPSVIDIKFFDSDGLDLPTSKEKAIEGSFFREEFVRAQPAEVGTISFPSRVLDYYEEGFLHALDLEALHQANYRIVVDYGFGNASTVLPAVIGKTGLNMVALNAYLDETQITKTREEHLWALKTLSDIVVSLKAKAGFLIDSGAEKLFLVDEQGKILDGDLSLASIAKLVLSCHPGATIAVPVAASSTIEEMAKESGGQVIYTKTSYRSMMEEARKKGVQFTGEMKGGFIFPQFQPVFDGMYALAKIMEMLAKQTTSLQEVAASVPRRVLLREHLACPWDMKGTIMRRLIEEHKDGRIISIDGVKVFTEVGWVFVLPDKDRPILHVNAEAKDEVTARRLVDEQLKRIGGWLA